MRIIAGTARGTQLFAPKGMETRPTRDQVKESLFSMLQGELMDAEVLDLFAGSGALALEALSRGAAKAVLVDRDREAAACIRRNLEKLRFADRAKLLNCEWEQAVSKLAQNGEKFDLVFLDPPYRMTKLHEISDTLLKYGLLRPGAMMVLEHADGYVPPMSSAFEPVKERSYRDTVIHLFRLKEEEP